MSLHRIPMIRRMLQLTLRPVAFILHRARIMRPMIYVRMDGGLASQMHFYMIGRTMALNEGADVEYDLSWYDECGMDLDGRFVRNFDLLKFYPQLPFRKASSGLKLSLYRLLYKHVNDYEAAPSEWLRLKAPVYLDGYYSDPDGLYARMHDIFKDAHPAGADPADLSLAEEIMNHPDAVGIHVRRGDLSVAVYSYGTPASDEYFRKTINYLKSRHGDDIPFFIFSDEPEWVTSHLLPTLPDGDYRIMQRNGSDKGYLDLWLLSKCHHFITSKGSFGKYAAILSPRRGEITLCDSPESYQWLSHLPDAKLF